MLENYLKKKTNKCLEFIKFYSINEYRNDHSLPF